VRRGQFAVTFYKVANLRRDERNGTMAQKDLNKLTKLLPSVFDYQTPDEEVDADHIDG